MNIHCSNCDRVFDSKIENYEDHENSKCNWTSEDKKDFQLNLFAMFLFISGIVVGGMLAVYTKDIMSFIGISLPFVILSICIQFKVLEKSPSQSQDSVK